LFALYNRTHSKTTYLALMLCIVLLAQAFQLLLRPADAYAAAAQPELNLEVKAAVLIEAETGQVLYEVNKDQLLPPASMSKMMSEYVILSQIESGKINWEDRVTISEYASKIGGSGGLLAAGETYTVEELFRNLSIFSGNDASIALAEYISGSEEEFSHLLNSTAKSIGLSEGAYFINATGLDRADMEKRNMAPASLPGETEITALDAAKIAQRIVLDFPETLEITSTTVSYLKPGDDRYRMENWNWMLGNWKGTGNDFDKLFAYEGLDGLKTGHTTRAGYSFTGTAERSGMRLISVVMAAPTMHKRFHETKKIMDYGFNNFEKMIALQPKTALEQLQSVSITKGKVKEVSLVTDAGAEFLVPKGTKTEDFIIEAVEADKEERIAPIVRGQVLGHATVSFQTPSGEVLSKKVNLVSADDAEKASWFALLFRGIGDFFKNMIKGITNLF
jgi:D-alanyl-D-alanine carboxypeptidase (penicillin-binding protein 5/6)